MGNIFNIENSMQKNFVRENDNTKFISLSNTKFISSYNNELDKFDEKIVIKELIDSSNDYYKMKGYYLDIYNGRGRIKIYKNMFKTLSSDCIFKLYNACEDGLELKPFEKTYLKWSNKLSNYSTIKFDNEILNIINSDDGSSSCISINISNTCEQSLFQILEWIKKSLNELYPELNEGFLFIMCGYMMDNKSNKMNPLKMNKNFIKKFEQVYKKEYIQDEYLGINSKSRQDTCVHDLLKNLNIDELEDMNLTESKIVLYKIPKFILAFSKIKFSSHNQYGENININTDLLFYCKFHELNIKSNKMHFSSSKLDSIYQYNSELFEQLQNLNNLITYLDSYLNRHSVIEIN